MKKLITTAILLSLLAALPRGVAAADEPSNSKPTFSGVLWTTYWHAVSGGSNNASKGTANSFDVKRVYLNAVGKLDEHWSYKIIFEMGGTPAGSGLIAFAKAANVRWALPYSMKQSVTFGLQPTLTWSTSETYWGYRVVMNTARENLGTTVVGFVVGISGGTAADFGINYSLKTYEWMNISLLVSNGAGHKTSEANMYKKIGLAIAVSPVEQSVIELYVDNEGGAAYTDNNGKVQIESRSGVGIFAGYRDERFGFGVDYFQKTFPEKTSYDVTDGTKYEVEANSVSLFGNYAMHEKLRLLMRYDIYTPVKDKKALENTFEKSGESLLIVGADCSYGPPNTNFILTFQQRSFEAKYNDGISWNDRDSYSLVALDVALKF